MRTASKLHPLIGWILVLPLRVLPPFGDPWISKSLVGQLSQKFVLPPLGKTAGADDQTALQVAACNQLLDKQSGSTRGADLRGRHQTEHAVCAG